MKYIIIASFLCFLHTIVYGQNSFEHNIPVERRHYYNVAASGLENSDKNNYISLYMKHKFVDVDTGMYDKSDIYMLNVIGKTSFLPGFYSAGYINEKQTLYTRHSILAGYSYDISLGKLGELTLGARLVLNLDKIDWDNYTLARPKNSKSLNINPDVDLGVNYKFNELSIGLAIKNVARNNTYIVNNIAEIEDDMDLFGSVFYNFKVTEYIITPYIFAYHQKKSGIDVGVIFRAFNKFEASYAVCLRELRGILAARVRVYKGLRIGVAINSKGLYKDNDLDLLIGYSF